MTGTGRRQRVEEAERRLKDALLTLALPPQTAHDGPKADALEDLNGS